MLVDGDDFAVVCLHKLQTTTCSRPFNGCHLLPFICFQIGLHLPQLSLVHLAGFFSIVLEGHVVAMTLFLLHAFVPFLGLLNSPIPCSLPLKVFSRRFSVSFQ